MEYVETLFNRIPDGSDKPLYVDNRNVAFRERVAEANRNGDVIINIHGGYFRPIPGQDDDLVEHYFARELKRARSIQYKRLKMKEAWNDKRA